MNTIYFETQSENKLAVVSLYLTIFQSFCFLNFFFVTYFAPDYDTRLWTEDLDLGRGPTETLSAKEDAFWNNFLGKYLPTSANDEQKQLMRKDLKSLRRKAVIALFVINFLIIVLLESLLQFEEVASAGSNLTLHIQYNCRDETFAIDPVALSFMAVFGVTLLIQMYGMLSHRFFTLLQIVSMTNVRKKNVEKVQDNEDVIQIAQQVIREANLEESGTLKLDGSMGNFGLGSGTGTMGVANRLTVRGKAQRFQTLDEKFASAFVRVGDAMDSLTRMNTLYNSASPRRFPDIPDMPPESSSYWQRRPSIGPRNTAQKTALAMLSKRPDVFSPDRMRTMRRVINDTFRGVVVIPDSR